MPKVLYTEVEDKVIVPHPHLHGQLGKPGLELLVGEARLWEIVKIVQEVSGAHYDMCTAEGDWIQVKGAVWRVFSLAAINVQDPVAGCCLLPILSWQHEARHGDTVAGVQSDNGSSRLTKNKRLV